MPLQSQRGVTLVELLLAMALGAILLAPLTTLFQSAADSARDARTQLDLEEQARFAVQRIAGKVRATKVVNLPATPADTASALAPRRYWIRSTGAQPELMETDTSAVPALRDRVLAAPVASLSVTPTVPTDGAPLVRIAVVMAGGQAIAAASETVRPWSAP